MDDKESEGKCFTFLWKLENISYCFQKKGERIGSPCFVVDAINQTKWRLRLYPRGKRDGNCIGCFLHREADSEGPDEVEIKYELDVLAKDGIILISHGIANDTFPKGKGFGYEVFQKLEDIYISRRSTYLPQDTLRVRCKIWKIDGEIAENVRCTAHTRIRAEKRNFLWNVKNFSSLEPEKKCTYQIKSIENDAPLMSLDLSLTGGLSSDEIIHFELFLRDETIKFATLSLFLLNGSGKTVECNKEEIWFEKPDQRKQLTFCFTKRKLLQEKSTYLQNDTLSLLWEWTFSKGLSSEEIEVVQYGCEDSEIKTSPTHIADTEKTCLLNFLVGNVKSLYDEQFLCDVKLNTKTSVFPAHKFILSANSSVFKAMFSSNLKENGSDFVNIEDFNDDTIRRMLLYVYTMRVEDLTWDSAVHLYVAADKYAILSLKNICSSYMKENLSPSNTCEVLLLSEFHADGDLKSAVQNYILNHGRQITNSNEWKNLVETNPKLAVETLCRPFK